MHRRSGGLIATVFPVILKGYKVNFTNRSSRPPSRENVTDWERTFEAAVLETDNAVLSQRIETAEASIVYRLRTISHGPETREEQNALEEAMSMLCVLKEVGLAN